MWVGGSSPFIGTRQLSRPPAVCTGSLPAPLSARATEFTVSARSKTGIHPASWPLAATRRGGIRRSPALSCTAAPLSGAVGSANTTFSRLHPNSNKIRRSIANKRIKSGAMLSNEQMGRGSKSAVTASRKHPQRAGRQMKDNNDARVDFGFSPSLPASNSFRWRSRVRACLRWGGTGADLCLQRQRGPLVSQR